MLRFTARLLALTPPLFAVLLAACGGDDSSGSGASFETALRGIYTLDDWTSNDMGCDAEGASVLATNGYTRVAIKADSFGGYRFVVAVPCNDADDCASRAGASVFASLAGGEVFTEGSDTAGWTGAAALAATSGAGCAGVVAAYSLTSPEEGAVRIETRSTEVTFDATSSKDDPCPADEAESVAKGQPCTRLEVQTATYEQELGEPPES